MTLHLEKVFGKFKDLTESMERLRAFEEIALEGLPGFQDRQDTFELKRTPVPPSLTFVGGH